MCNALNRFDKSTFHSFCDVLSARDADLAAVIKRYGYPPMWTRAASFPTLIQIILEQQVSLASAKAAFSQLTKKMGVVTPVKFLKLSDEELKACYFSRQKIIYAKELASAVTRGRLSFNKLKRLPVDEIRQNLKTIKGIGDWTVDIYLLHALRRTDVFPLGDLALVSSIKMVKQLSSATKEELLKMGKRWKPYRSIATMLFWHYYIKKKNIKILH